MNFLNNLNKIFMANDPDYKPQITEIKPRKRSIATFTPENLTASSVPPSTKRSRHIMGSEQQLNATAPVPPATNATAPAPAPAPAPNAAQPAQNNNIQGPTQ